MLDDETPIAPTNRIRRARGARVRRAAVGSRCFWAGFLRSAAGRRKAHVAIRPRHRWKLFALGERTAKRALANLERACARFRIGRSARRRSSGPANQAGVPPHRSRARGAPPAPYWRRSERPIAAGRSSRCASDSERLAAQAGRCRSRRARSGDQQQASGAGNRKPHEQACRQRQVLLSFEHTDDRRHNQATGATTAMRRRSERGVVRAESSVWRRASRASA